VTTFVHRETTSEVKNCPGAPGKLTYFASPQATGGELLIAGIAKDSFQRGKKKKEGRPKT
jgi:hypothetical protein